MADETASATPPQGINRREAMLQLLRLGGVAAGTAGAAFWLSSRSVPPLPHCR
jgi:hypothetical protein